MRSLLLNLLLLQPLVLGSRLVLVLMLTSPNHATTRARTPTRMAATAAATPMATAANASCPCVRWLRSPRFWTTMKMTTSRSHLQKQNQPPANQPRPLLLLRSLSLPVHSQTLRHNRHSNHKLDTHTHRLCRLCHHLQDLARKRQLSMITTANSTRSHP